MTTFNVNPGDAAKLSSAAGLVEVCDEAGRVLGFFAPVSMELADKYAQAAAQLYPVKQRRSKTTAEVLEQYAIQNQAQ